MMIVAQRMIKLTGLFFLLILVGCEKDYYEEKDDTTKNPLFKEGETVPPDFDWRTTHPVDIRVVVDDQYRGVHYYGVEVYDANPLLEEGASLIGKGVARQNEDYRSVLNLPYSTEVVYVKQLTPTGGASVMALPAVSNMEVSFRPLALRKASADRSLKGVPDDLVLEYPTPADAVEITETSGSLLLEADWNASKARSYVIRGNYTGSITFNGGSLGVALYIEGSWINTGEALTVGQKDKLVLQSGARLTTTKDPFTITSNNTGVLSVAPNATFGSEDLDIKLVLTDANRFSNGGLAFINTANISSKAIFYNYGDTKIASLSSSDLTNRVVNDGHLSIGSFHNYGGSGNATFDNYCRLDISDLKTEGATLNLHAGSSLFVDKLKAGNSKFILSDEAILDVKETELQHNNEIKGADANEKYALARLGQVVLSNGGNVYEGRVEIASTSHTPNGDWVKYTLRGAARMLTPGALSELDIEASECNGNGNRPEAGEPEDVVFPIIYSERGLTYLFEDNWPYLGDYDMNDLVVDIIPEYTADSKNLISRLSLKIDLRAVGATKHLALGIQLDGVERSNIQSVSRNNQLGLTGKVFALANGLENGTKKAILPVFDDVHTAFGYVNPMIVNTVKGGNQADKATVVLHIDFLSPVSKSSVTLNKLNVFIVNGGYQGKRREIHMTGFEPTEKADVSLLNFGDVSADKLYRSGGNMIWALALPASFAYPVEWTKISDAYTQFTAWAISGGVDNTNWYKTPNEEKLIKP